VLNGIGVSPNLAVEWKSFCREAGLVELSVEAVAEEGAWLGCGRLKLLVRGWRAAGWLGLRTVMGKEVCAGLREEECSGSHWSRELVGPTSSPRF